MPIIDEGLRGTPILPDHEPTELFHYTTATGLLGILNSRTLWATEVPYLNDASEFRYAGELFDEAVSKLNPGTLSLSGWKRVLSIDGVLDSFACHVACFCEEGDLLSQWRAYGGNGTGYTLAFDVPKLRALNFDGEEPLLGRVIYDRDTQLLIIKQHLEQALAPFLQDDLLVNIEREEPERTMQRVERFKVLFEGSIASAGSALFAVSAFLKFPRFSEEKEWRLVSLGYFERPHLLFGTSRGVLPRVSLELGFFSGRLFSESAWTAPKAWGKNYPPNWTGLVTFR
jgi:hypothetical protein